MVGFSSTPQKADASLQQTAGILVVLIVALFFFWGGITSLNDILIPKLKDLFSLNYTQAMLIQFAFFTAYALVSLPAGNLVAKLGYGRGIVAGLAIMAAGCTMFIPAAMTAQYAFFLGALFVLAGGVTILQVAANPLITLMGSEKKASSRLTLAQAFNSLGTTIWPLVGAHVILGSMGNVDSSTLQGAELAAHRATEANVVSMSYLVIALMLIALALPFWFSRNKLGGGSSAVAEKTSGGIGFELLKKPRLGFGVMSIFLYVGAEVAIGSLIVNFLVRADVLAMDEKSAGSMVAIYWGGAMVGRFIGAGLLSMFRAGYVLGFAALGASILALTAWIIDGKIAAYALLAVGLMNSIMFPTIFSLALEGLGKDTPKGSGLLCMGIVGGAIIPMATGMLADATSLAASLVIPAVCYVGIALYGGFTGGLKLKSENEPVIAAE